MINNRPRKILGWKTPPRYSASSYARYNNPVLQQSVELAQFRSRKFVLALDRHRMAGSLGRGGAAGDNAAMEYETVMTTPALQAA